MAFAFGYLSGLGRRRVLRGRESRTTGLTWVSLVIGWLLTVCAAAAQVPAPAVRFTVFSAARVGELAFTPHANAAPQKVVFYPTARSPHYEYRGAMPLRFVEPKTGAVVAEATLPAGMHEALLLFLPAEPGAAAGKAATALRYQIAVLDDSALQHAPGALAIVNLSGLALSGAVGGRNVTLKPGLNPPVAIERSAKVALRTTFKERSYQAYAGSVQLGPRQRALLLLLPPFYKGSLEVQSRLLIDEPRAGR